jgi:hypothetical protein
LYFILEMNEVGPDAHLTNGEGKMTGRKLAALLAAAIILASLGFAQTAAGSLAPSATVPIIDGSMSKGEYSLMQTVSGFWLGTSLSKDGQTLYIGVVAKATGWIAAGLGSTKMNGSYMIMAYNDGSQKISEQKGVGHGHVPAEGTKVTKYAVKTVNGMTCLEFSIPAAEWIKDGTLKLILAASNKADFTSYHPAIGIVQIPVTK